MTDPGMAPHLRPARTGDLPAVLALHNEFVVTSTAIWDLDIADPADRAAWFAERTAAGFPVLVAECDGQIAGYASYGPWRDRAGYRFTVENSVYIDPRFQRRGIARALLTELIATARASGRIHAMVAAIESGNGASIALHEQSGFQIVGQLPEVGHKFGNWMDLTLMQLNLPMTPAPGQ